jgi:hypothetical protein
VYERDRVAVALERQAARSKREQARLRRRDAGRAMLRALEEPRLNSSGVYACDERVWLFVRSGRGRRRDGRAGRRVVRVTMVGLGLRVSIVFLRPAARAAARARAVRVAPGAALLERADRPGLAVRVRAPGAAALLCAAPRATPPRRFSSVSRFECLRRASAGGRSARARGAPEPMRHAHLAEAAARGRALRAFWGLGRGRA